MWACSIAACSSRRTHGRLSSVAMMMQDDLLLVPLVILRVLPLNGLKKSVVSIDDFVTSHFPLELLWKYFEQSIKEFLFIVERIGGMLVEIISPTPDVLGLHGASAPIVEKSTSARLGEHMVTLVFKEHRIP